MAGAASAHQAATASREQNSQQRAGRTRRTSADPQRDQQGATAAAAAAPAALDSLSRLQQLADASPQVAQLRRLQALADAYYAPAAQLAGGPEEEELIQGKFATAQPQSQLQQAPRVNNTGLPDQLKSGIESLSGLSMDHVRVHYNSAQPAQLNALAYAQGSDIHLAPGQERHLPHEAWHVVQQAQGRVRPTMQMKEGELVNDDVGLESEADVMGSKALEGGHRADETHRSISMPIETAQLIEGDTTNSPDVNVANNDSGPLANGRGSAQRGGNEVQRIADQRPDAALQRQVQGRVKPTDQLKRGGVVNDDAGLVRGADVKGGRAAEVSLDAPAPERVTSAAPPTGAVLQRTIRIGSTLYTASNARYTASNARYFRRELMMTLAQLDFPEKGTRAMWKRVEAWLKDGKEHPFADWRTLIANLYDQRLMEKRMIAGAAMGPRDLGNRPTFTTGVTKLLELSKDESQARRHVISSSTLGRAIELVTPALETLNAWLLRHGMSEQPSTASTMDVREAKRRIWEHVHNHLGNLWVGPSMPNSAIGFIRGPILSAVEGARKHMAGKDSDTVPLDSLIKLLPSESPWRDELFAKTWNNVRATLIEQLKICADQGGQVDGVAAVALMVEWIRNADLDLPMSGLDSGYFNRLSSIYGRLLYPTQELFAEKGALDDFLGLGLGLSPKVSASASSKKDSSSPMETSDAPKLPVVVPELLHGAGRIHNVSGEGMNCLIRSLLVASGRGADDSVVSALRTYLLSQGVADQADMLDLAGEAGAVLISYMQAQGLLAANRGLVVYTPANLNPPIAILGGANPIRLWLSDNHFRAIVHE
jgi:hypothetical protein